MTLRRVFLSSDITFASHFPTLIAIRQSCTLFQLVVLVLSVRLLLQVHRLRIILLRGRLRDGELSTRCLPFFVLVYNSRFDLAHSLSALYRVLCDTQMHMHRDICIVGSPLTGSIQLSETKLFSSTVCKRTLYSQVDCYTCTDNLGKYISNVYESVV